MHRRSKGCSFLGLSTLLLAGARTTERKVSPQVRGWTSPLSPSFFHLGREQGSDPVCAGGLPDVPPPSLALSECGWRSQDRDGGVARNDAATAPRQLAPCTGRFLGRAGAARRKEGSHSSDAGSVALAPGKLNSGAACRSPALATGMAPHGAGEAEFAPLAYPLLTRACLNRLDRELTA